MSVANIIIRQLQQLFATWLHNSKQKPYLHAPWVIKLPPERVTDNLSQVEHMETSRSFSLNEESLKSPTYSELSQHLASIIQALVPSPFLPCYYKIIRSVGTIWLSQNHILDLYENKTYENTVSKCIQMAHSCNSNHSNSFYKTVFCFWYRTSYTVCVQCYTNFPVDNSLGSIVPK